MSSPDHPPCLSTRLQVRGSDRQRATFRELHASKLSIVASFAQFGEDLYEVEVLRLQRSIRQARECGLEASEVVPAETEGGVS